MTKGERSMADSRGVRRAVLCMLLCAGPACSGSADPAARASSSADAVSASRSKADQSDRKGNDYCALFTTAQIAAVLGKPVKSGNVPEMATDACQWEAADGKGVVSIDASFAGLWHDLSGRA